MIVVWRFYGIFCSIDTALLRLLKRRPVCESLIAPRAKVGCVGRPDLRRSGLQGLVRELS